MADIDNVTSKIDVGENDVNYLLREDTVSYDDCDYNYDYDNDYNSNDFQPTDAALQIITTQSSPAWE